jgi:hypothetical protein
MNPVCVEVRVRVEEPTAITIFEEENRMEVNESGKLIKS